ncbi:MAG TPA: rhomboid family intramembrane serine protease [Anaerolineae bacterium]
MEVTGGSANAPNLVRFGANYAPLVTAGQYWRLVTANFLHIGALHLLVNSYALYVLGREVETIFGSARFTALYLLSGISGAVFSYMLTQGLSAGASTSLFGLFGALAIFFYKQRKLLGTFGQQRLVNLGITLVINVIIGLSPGSNIDNWGHVGGVIGGAILAWYLCPVYSLANPSDGPAPAIADDGTVMMPINQLIDTNPRNKQLFAVGLFGLGLVVLTVAARMVQSS